MSVKKEEREGLGSSALFGLEVQSAAPVKDAAALFPYTYLTLSPTPHCAGSFRLSSDISALRALD